MSNKKYQPILGVIAVVLFAGAAWIAYPSLVILFQNQYAKTNLAAVGATGSATLTWNANTESDLASYKVYYGTSPRTGTDPKTCGMCGYASSTNVGKVTTYTLTGLTNGQTYYFSITALDTSNNESSFSSEVNKVIAEGGIKAAEEAAVKEFRRSTLGDIGAVVIAIIEQFNIYIAPIIGYGPSDEKGEGEQSRPPR